MSFSNKIKDFHGMMFLGLCNNLKVLDMTNNPITQKENYRDTVRQNIPALMFLDRMPYEEVSDDVRRDFLRSEYQPGNNGAVRRHPMQTVRIISSVVNELTRGLTMDQRAISAAPPVTHISIRRPTTADPLKPKYDISVGEPVCGNIITKARKPRKLKTAWGESCSSSSFSSSDSSSQGTPVNRRVAEESSEDLLESARLWRENSKVTRNKFNK